MKDRHAHMQSAEELQAIQWSTTQFYDVACRAEPMNTSFKLAKQGVPMITWLIEVLGQGHWCVHSDIACSIDAILAGNQPETQLRMHQDGKLVVRLAKDDKS